MKGRKTAVAVLVILAVIGILFVIGMNYGFEHSDKIRSLFSGGEGDVMGEVAPNSAQSIASRTRYAAWLSMLIFSVITAMQLVAFGAGWSAAKGVEESSETVSTKLKQLDNAGVFFDVPLYVGLFGTVSAFLVMTFSPQSSRLIAYSSTLIGIIFSLILKLTMEYPLRKRLLRASEDSGKGTAK